MELDGEVTLPEGTRVVVIPAEQTAEGAPERTLSLAEWLERARRVRSQLPVTTDSTQLPRQLREARAGRVGEVHHDDQHERSLPEAMKRFVEEQVEQGPYSTPSEYSTLIREAQARAEKAELERRLLEGLESPASEMTPEDWKALRQRILDRNPGLRDE